MREKAGFAGREIRLATKLANRFSTEARKPRIGRSHRELERKGKSVMRGEPGKAGVPFKPGEQDNAEAAKDDAAKRS